MNLKHLSDKELLSVTTALVLNERQLSIKVLHHLREIDRRRLYSDQGYSSLFDYAVRCLGYSAGSAYRRVQGARTLAEIPEVEEKLEAGALTLTHLTDAATFFRENNIKNIEQKKTILKEVEGLGKKDTALKLHEFSKKPIKRMIPVPLSEETIRKVDHWRGFKTAQKTTDELISEALDVAIVKVERSRFGQAGRPRQEEAAQGISTATKREVYLRDQKRCTNCGTTHFLQFDHRIPKALGGSNDKENIRLLCFACNQRAGIRAGVIKES